MPGQRIEIRGTVQGVGFRPWVARIARATGITGLVRNDARGVVIEAFGPSGLLEGFLSRLQADTPPSARILELRATPIPERLVEGFAIETSLTGADKTLSIPPDLATCDECMDEVSSASDRRHGYAFTNCTACGPRFTIAIGIPYDRPSTTMASFEMCARCLAEYENQEDRRYHAQPNACPDCGPRLRLVSLDAELVRGGDPITEAATLLARGSIVGVKGLGGFHLACDATSEDSIQLLRERKRRDEKPFAVMVRDLEEARDVGDLTPEEEQLLTSPERPIVLVPRRPGCVIASAVSPDTPLLGLFLPYTPLHHLLLRAVGRPLVMTSGNVTDEPICPNDEEARRRLRGIADALLLHDREIAMRCDDSVARVIAGAPTVMRRSRGFVPSPFVLRTPVAQPVLACGAHLKNTFCLAVDDRAYFGPHIGDLETVAALTFFEEAVERMESILSIRPELIAYDLHPGYLSTRYALARDTEERVGVQHHHAHVVSAMAEHGLEGPVLGVAFDGTGLGSDGTSWGSEFLFCAARRFERLATFRPIRLPGGNVAMREVWRIAQALLDDAFEGDAPLAELSLFDQVPEKSQELVQQMLDRDLHAPPAHGVGRYFDAFGALGLRRAVSSYEGQVAIAWDFAGDDSTAAPYPFDIDRTLVPIEVDLRPAVRATVEDLRASVAPGRISSRFHATIVTATVAVVRELLKDLGPVPVALSGGVFHNAGLCAGIARELSNEIELLRHQEVPPGDGGIALGQALIGDAFSRDKG